MKSKKTALKIGVDVTDYTNGMSIIKRTDRSCSRSTYYRDPEKLVKIGKAVIAGLAINEICKQFDVNRKLVYRWTKRLGLGVRKPFSTGYKAIGWRFEGIER